jgi:hypothetical protein
MKDDRSSRDHDETIVVTARVVNHKSHCRRCGQFLWYVENGRLSSRFGSVEGKRLVAGIWTLTRQGCRDRRNDAKTANDPAASPDARREARYRVTHNRGAGGRAEKGAAESIAGGSVVRTPVAESENTVRHAEQTAAISTLPPEILAGLLLPAKVKCPNCPAINLIAGD